MVGFTLNVVILDLKLSSWHIHMKNNSKNSCMPARTEVIRKSLSQLKKSQNRLDLRFFFY